MTTQQMSWCQQLNIKGFLETYVINLNHTSTNVLRRLLFVTLDIIRIYLLKRAHVNTNAWKLAWFTHSCRGRSHPGIERQTFPALTSESLRWPVPLFYTELLLDQLCAAKLRVYSPVASLSLFSPHSHAGRQRTLTWQSVSVFLQQIQLLLDMGNLVDLRMPLQFAVYREKVLSELAAGTYVTSHEPS